MEKSIPEQLKEFRSRLMLSQEKLAHQIGVSLGTIRNWENGVGEPSISQFKMIEKLAAEAGVEQ